VIADYDRRNFSVSPCKWDAQAKQNIVAILPPASSNSTSSSLSSSSKSSLPLGPIIGGAVGGGVVLIIIVIGIFIFLRRRKSKTNTEETAAATNNEEPFLKPELDGFGVSASKQHPEGQELDSKERNIYEKGAGEVVPKDNKYHGTEHAVEIGGSGTGSPIYEMAAEEVAVEMASAGLHLQNSAQRAAAINSEVSSPESRLSAVSPASAHDSITLVSPESARDSRTLGIARSPEAVSPASLGHMGRSPIDESWAQRP